MLKAFLLIAKLLMHRIFLAIFFLQSWAVSSLQYLLIRWWSRGHETMRKHGTLPVSLLISSFTFCPLEACQYTRRLEHNPWKVTYFKPSIVFHDYCQRRLKHFLLYWRYAACKLSHQADYFLTFICSMNFLTEVPKPRYASIAKSQSGGEG